MASLKLENLSYVYGEDTPFKKEALKDINISFNENKITGIIGHTGSGKSTLAQIISGIISPKEGKVFLDGENIFESKLSLKNSRNKIGLVFQYPEYQLFEETVYKDIAFGPANMGKSSVEIDKLVKESAEFVGLDLELLNKSPFEISGGQKRRAAIAGILAMDPEILILDEPAAGLDPGGREDLLGRLKTYQKEKNKTVLIISHSMEDMANFADYILVMKNGSVLFHGTVTEAFSNPEMIIDANLDLPSISKLLIMLKNKGVPVDTSVHTVNDAVFHLSKIFKGAKEC